MNSTTIFYGLLPTLVALCVAVASLYIAIKARGFFQFVASGVVVTGVGWSLLILYRTFVLGAWPTFLPHIVIIIALVVVIAQAGFLASQSRSSITSA